MNGLYLQYEELQEDGKKVNELYIVDRDHQRSVVVVDHSRNFKGIQGELLLKTKKLSKLIYQIDKSPHYNQQAEPKQCKSEFEEMYSSKPGNWPSQHLYMKVNTGCLAVEKIPLKKLFLKVVKLMSYMKQQNF